MAEKYAYSGRRRRRWPRPFGVAVETRLSMCGGLSVVAQTSFGENWRTDRTECVRTTAYMNQKLTCAIGLRAGGFPVDQLEDQRSPGHNTSTSGQEVPANDVLDRRNSHEMATRELKSKGAPRAHYSFHCFDFRVHRSGEGLFETRMCRPPRRHPGAC